MIEISYNKFKIQKSCGGFRTILAPNDKLRAVQSFLKNKLETEITFNQNITGFVKGKSIKDNAQFHINKKFILNIDIKDFFNSITTQMIIENFSFIKDFTYHDNIYNFSYTVTYNGKLPQGAPTSPIIANYIFQNTDNEIMTYLEKVGLKNMSYSRYADDISISFDTDINHTILVKNISKIISKYGFLLNYKKTKFFTSTKKMVVTGLVVNERVAYPKYNYMILRSSIFNLLDKGFGYFPEVKGYLNYLGSIDSQKYEKLKDYYGKKFKENKLYLELFNISPHSEVQLDNGDTTKIRNKKRYHSFEEDIHNSKQWEKELKMRSKLSP